MGRVSVANDGPEGEAPMALSRGRPATRWGVLYNLGMHNKPKARVHLKTAPAPAPSHYDYIAGKSKRSHDDMDLHKMRFRGGPIALRSRPAAPRRGRGGGRGRPRSSGRRLGRSRGRGSS